MIEKQDKTINILGEVEEDTASIRDDISVLRLDTLESLHEKYDEMRKEIAEIKAALIELKAKAA